MDRLAEAAAEYLRRHRSVGASPPHARRRLGAVEVVRGAAAKRRYTPRERGLAQARRRPSTEPAKLTNPTPNRQLRRMAYLSRFFLVFAFAGRRRMASRFHPTPCEMNVKRGSKPTAEETKNQRKT